MTTAPDARSHLREPRRITSAAVAIGGLCALLAVAARTSGAGWLIVLLSALAGSLLVGFVWPRLALLGLRVRAEGPMDATVGRPFELRIQVSRPGLGLLARIPGGAWWGILDDGPVTVPHVPERRGQLDVIEVELACGAPFGFSWQRRRVGATLRRPVLVAPRAGEATVRVPNAGDRDGELAAGSTHAGDQLRSVRDYAVGDPLRLVHWPATARRGELIVKELETPARPKLNLVLELIGRQDADDAAAEQAMGIVLQTLATPTAVSLFTHGPDGPSRCDVRGPLDAGRALAVAVAGRPAQPPAAAINVVRIGAGAS